MDPGSTLHMSPSLVQSGDNIENFGKNEYFIYF